MSLNLYDRVALCCDLPEHHLKKGDVAILIDYVPHPQNSEKGAILEVFNAIGESIAVISVPLSAIESLHSNEILTVLSLVDVS